MKYIISKPHSIYELGKRANQEDNIYPKHGEATADDTLFIVCDGMGGHESGEVASSTVCEVMSSYIREHDSGDTFTEEDFQNALSATYSALDAKDSGAEKKMGTTMTFMKFHSQGCLMAHIGDSRMYHIRPSTKEMLFKSRDHSLINDLIELGEMSEEEAKTSSQKNIITRAIQPNQERRAKAAIKLISDIQAGDYFYICTDGMLEEMEDENIINVISMDNNDSEKIRILTELTVENKDNHSAYLVCIKEVAESKELPLIDITPVKSSTKSRKSVRVTSSSVKRSRPANQKKIKTQQTGSKIKISQIIFAIMLILIFAISFYVYRSFAKSEPVKVENRTTANHTDKHPSKGNNIRKNSGGDKPTNKGDSSLVAEDHHNEDSSKEIDKDDDESTDTNTNTDTEEHQAEVVSYE